MQRPHAQLVYSAEHAQTQLHRDGRLLTGVMHTTLLVCIRAFHNTKGAGGHALVHVPVVTQPQIVKTTPLHCSTGVMMAPPTGVHAQSCAQRGCCCCPQQPGICPEVCLWPRTAVQRSYSHSLGTPCASWHAQILRRQWMLLRHHQPTAWMM